MRAVVVYESMFGDTRQIAEAIGKGLGNDAEVTVVPVNRVTADQLTGADLLVVGGPTHVRGMSRPKTRAGAVAQASHSETGIVLEPEAAGSGLREWFTTLTEVPHVRLRSIRAFSCRPSSPAGPRRELRVPCNGPEVT